MNYLEKSALYSPLIQTNPVADLNLIVVIPSFDEKELLISLNSIAKCRLSNFSVEVIVIVNCSENADIKTIETNKISYKAALNFSQNYSHNRLRFYVFNFLFPLKDAGVGLARKVGMDEAVRRFESLKQDGIIVCFDADSRCDQHYLVEIEKAFLTNPKAPGASIYFEHPLQGIDFQEDIYNGIVQYELFLRYYCNGLRFAGHPHAYQTIGSSMAVRSKVYQAQGGMNKRKAGEDFYFLEKIIPLGNFIEINTTCVIPSPRPSHRVPFGTGKAIVNWLETKSQLTYNPLIFIDLKKIFTQIGSIYQNSNLETEFENLPESFKKFISKNHFVEKTKEIRANTNSLVSFENRFFKWFDLFMCLKYVHFCKNQIYKQIPINEAVIQLYGFKNLDLSPYNTKELLIKLRGFDNEGFKY